MCNYLNLGKWIRILFKELLFLALVVILLDRVEPSRSILVKGSMRNVYVTLFEPVHEISNNLVCATSKVSDQPGQTRSLIRAFASRLNIL